MKKLNHMRQNIHRIEQGNQDLNKKLSEKREEASNIKDLNHKLLEEIKSLREEKLKNFDLQVKDQDLSCQNGNLV